MSQNMSANANRIAELIAALETVSRSPRMPVPVQSSAARCPSSWARAAVKRAVTAGPPPR